MRAKTLVIGLIGVAIGVALTSAVGVLAGSPVDPPGPPASTSSYTLESIYNRLDSGAPGLPSTFTEPVGVPGTGTMHTLDQIMAKAPVSDDTNGATTAEVLKGKTFWGLGAGGAWGRRTGARSAGPVAKTGQTTCYDASGTPLGSCTGTGQDGEYQKGVAWPNPRFTDNSNGTVTDNLTGLIWLKNANCYGYQTWATALASANALYDGQCGLTDGSTAGQWRLPSAREISSLVDFGGQIPALPSNHPFSGLTTDLGIYYWTSTTYAYLSYYYYAWVLSSADGHLNAVPKVQACQVWPVRDGQ